MALNTASGDERIMVMIPENPNSGHRRRLKERFANSSLEGFHDYEAIELLLTFAIPRRDVKSVAKELLRRFKGLNGVLDATVEELQTIKGVGQGAANLIALVKEAAAAYLNEAPTSAKTIKSAKDVIACLGERISHSSDGENKLFAVYLSSRNDVLGIESVSTGALEKHGTGTRKIISSALRFNARSVIFVHSLRQSTVDPANAMERAIAKELTAAASAVEVVVHDYLVACEDKLLSAYESGWLGR
ncbi:MAG: RadC family protein [Deltaproteobacteria bacterium]|nr:RadC family protein [Deltaproteobacteria bacterium]